MNSKNTSGKPTLASSGARPRTTPSTPVTKPQITQGELLLYLGLIVATKRQVKMREILTARLEAGATVEPGELTARIDREPNSYLSADLVRQVFGQAALDELFAAARAKTVRRLRVIDPHGKYLGWHAGRRDPSGNQIGPNRKSRTWRAVKGERIEPPQ